MEKPEKTFFKIREVAPCRREVAVEVSAAEMGEELARVLRRIGRGAQIPGFRPGKAPDRVISSRFGAEARREALQNKLSESFFQGCREHSLPILGSPEFSEVSWEDDSPLKFKASFDITPSFELAPYRGIELVKPAASVSEEEIEQELEKLRERSATFETEATRPLRAGDFALVDYRSQDPKQSDDEETAWVEGILLEIKPPEADDDFSGQLLGLEPGEIRSVRMKEDGKEKKENPPLLQVRLQEIKKKVLPDLSDELASTWGPFANLQEVRLKLEEALGEQREEQARRNMESQALEKLKGANEFALPPTALKSFQEGQLALLRSWSQNGEKAPAEEELAARAAELAEGELKAIFILREIARREKIEVSPAELGEEIAREARQRGENPSTYRKRLEEEDSLSAVEDRLRRQRALELVLAEAEIKEEKK